MTLKQLDTLGRKELPEFISYSFPSIRITLTKDLDWASLFEYANEEYPNTMIPPVYILEYRKQIQNGIFIGWEFIRLVNGI